MSKLDAIVDTLLLAVRPADMSPKTGLTSGWPSKQAIRVLTDKIVDILFIERLHAKEKLKTAMGKECRAIHRLLSAEIAKGLCHNGFFSDVKLRSIQDIKREAARLGLAVLAELSVIKGMLEKDAEAAFRGDPAAKSIAEIHLSYPGFFAIAIHRVAHFLYSQKVPLLPRMLAEDVHSRTGIDIHPGATIGDSFFIDHGTGVVIGETTVIGARVKLYQGVTLGALSIPDRFVSGQRPREGEAPGEFTSTGGGDASPFRRRHPMIEDDVTIYAGATILGGSAVIGKGSIIGGNVWLTQSVPPYTKVFNGTPSLVYEDLKQK